MQTSEAWSQEQFAALYRRHIKLVYQICLLMLKNVPDAGRLSIAFRDPEHEKAWLIVTARNECRDQLKHWWRRGRTEPEELDRLTWQPPEDSGVWEQVAALPPRERLMLYLFYYQGYSTKEVAEFLGEKPSTLRAQMTRARHTLKLRLEAEGYGPQ